MLSLRTDDLITWDYIVTTAFIAVYLHAAWSRVAGPRLFVDKKKHLIGQVMSVKVGVSEIAKYQTDIISEIYRSKCRNISREESATTKEKDFNVKSEMNSRLIARYIWLHEMLLFMLNISINYFVPRVISISE